MKRYCVMLCAVLLLCSCLNQSELTSDAPSQAAVASEPEIQLESSEPELEISPEDKELYALNGKSIDELTNEDLTLLFDTERDEIERVFGYEPPVPFKLDKDDRHPNPDYFKGKLPIERFYAEYGETLIILDKTAPEPELEYVATQNIYYISSRQAVFGVAPGEPMERFSEVFGEIDIRRSVSYRKENYSYFFMVQKGDFVFQLTSAEMDAPIYKEMRVWHSPYTAALDETDPYLRLIGRGLSELTEEDFKMLLITPVQELARIYDLKLGMPPEMPVLSEDAAKSDYFEAETIERNISRFKYWGYSCELPFAGISFQYNDLSPNALPMYILANSWTEKINGLQLGTKLPDIMAEWGEVERQTYGTGPYGYWGAFYQYVEYKGRGGFDYHLECAGYADRNEPWYKLDESEWPWEDFPQVVTYAIISLEGSGDFYARI